MTTKDNFSENIDCNLVTVFRQGNVPVFQNKVYPSAEYPGLFLIRLLYLIK